MKAAEAEAESKYLSGVGVSRQRKAIVDGLRDSVQTFSDTIDGAWCGGREIARQQHRHFLFYLAFFFFFFSFGGIMLHYHCDSGGRNENFIFVGVKFLG